MQIYQKQAQFIAIHYITYHVARNVETRVESE